MGKKIGFYLEDMCGYKHVHNNEELFTQLEDTIEEEKPLVVTKIVENNLSLIHYIIRKRYPNIQKLCQGLRITPDDIFGAGYYGLLKSIYTFDVSKGYKFATYATRCIHNEFGMFMRRSKRSFTQTSIHETMYNDGSSVDGEITLLDMLIDDTDFIHEVELEQFGFIVMEEMERKLSPKELAILRMYVAEDDVTQRDMAEQLGISQSYISRILKRTIHKAKNIYKKFEVV